MTAILVTPVAWIVGEKDRPIADEETLAVRIADDGAGAYVEIEGGLHTVQLDPERWPALREAIERAVRTIESMEEK